MVLTTSFDTLFHSFDPVNSLPFPKLHPLVVLNDSVVIYSSVNDNYDSLTPEYFAHSHTMSFTNIYTGAIRNFAPYRSESIYRKLIIPNDIFPHFTVLRDSIYLLFPHDPRLYIYDDKGELAHTLNLSPNHFTPLQAPSGNEIFDQLLFDQSNSSYDQIWANENYLITLYTTPLPEELRTANISRVDNLKLDRKNYLEIYDHFGEKACEDILLPKELLKIWAAPSLDSILLLRRFEVNEENIVLYQAKLHEKP